MTNGLDDYTAYARILEHAETVDTDEAWEVLGDYEDAHPDESAAFWAELFIRATRLDSLNYPYLYRTGKP